MKVSYCKQCGGKLPEDARFCPSCGTRVISETQPLEAHRILKVTDKPKVVVTNFSPGSVEIEHGAEGEVATDLDLRVPENLDWTISQDENVITVTCRMKVAWGWPYIFGPRPRANVHISVPGKADLQLENRAGRIAIHGVNGTISAESSAGTISARDCEGTIKVRTRAGSVNLNDVNGTITARSSAGSITFIGALSKGENWFRTNLGSIDITFKGEPELIVEASTDLGSIRCIPELADARYERNRHIGRIGAGTGKLIVETNAGSITIHS